MQRLHLHTGRRGRPRYPDAGAYPQPDHRDLWRNVAGDFLPDDSLACLSRQLLKEIDEALAGIAGCAWKVTDQAFEDSLLVRLLPFSSSLERDLPEHARLVYQSAAGAYLSIYEITGLR